MPQETAPHTRKASSPKRNASAQITKEQGDIFNTDVKKLLKIIDQNKPIAIMAAVGACAWIVLLSYFFTDFSISIPFADSAFVKHCSSQMVQPRDSCVCVDDVLSDRLSSQEYKLITIAMMQGKPAMEREMANLGLWEMVKLETKLATAGQQAGRTCGLR